MKNNSILFIIIIFSTQVYCQNLRVYKVENLGNSPKIEWYQTGKDINSKDISIWRTSLSENSFDSIQTINYVNRQKKDTLLYTIIDTTLTKKAIYKYFIRLKEIDKKSNASDIAITHNMGNIASPKVVLFNVTSSKTKKAIELNWELNNDFSVRTLSIFRSSHHEKGFVKIAELGKDETSYIDNVSLSNHNYFYFIQIADYFGYQYPSPATPGFCTFKQKPLSPKNLEIKKTNNEVELSWKNLESSLSGYKVYRSIGKEDFKPLHVMQTSNKLNETFVDKLPTKVKDYNNIRYYVVNTGDSYLDSNTSDTLSVFIEHNIKPVPPKEFDAVKQENNQVKLLWSLPNQHEIIGYNVYLVKPKLQKLNTEIIPRLQNYFLDENMRQSGQYQYAIESVNNLNQISSYRTKTSTSILSPYFHLVVDTQATKETFQLQWKQLNTKLINNIKLYRQEEEQTPKLLKQFENVDTTYTDNQLIKDRAYFYSFYAELVNGENVLLNDRIAIKF